jgi:D-alanine-D-alanine ligase-like ATP-grasp enzyme
MTKQRDQATVKELFEIVQRLWDEERSRGHGLEAKTSTLAGFTGAILALTASLGREVLTLDLGQVGDVAQRVFFALAVTALVVGALIAVFGVLRPQQRRAITVAALRQFSEFPLVASPPVEVQGRMIVTLVNALENERKINDRKARLSRLAALALAVGLAGVALQALVMVAAGP